MKRGIGAKEEDCYGAAFGPERFAYLFMLLCCRAFTPKKKRISSSPYSTTQAKACSKRLFSRSSEAICPPCLSPFCLQTCWMCRAMFALPSPQFPIPRYLDPFLSIFAPRILSIRTVTVSPFWPSLICLMSRYKSLLIPYDPFSDRSILSQGTWIFP